MWRAPVSSSAAISMAMTTAYMIDSAHKYPGRLYPVVILDPQDRQRLQSIATWCATIMSAASVCAVAGRHFLDTGWLCSPEAMDVGGPAPISARRSTTILFMNQLPYLLPLIKIIAGMFRRMRSLLDHGAMLRHDAKISALASRPVGGGDARAPPLRIDTRIAISGRAQVH